LVNTMCVWHKSVAGMQEMQYVIPYAASIAFASIALGRDTSVCEVETTRSRIEYIS
jgi:hypothetical protein